MNNMSSSSNRILVIGDTCTDVFVYGSCDRICPEAPVPVFIPKKTVKNNGMSGNVIDNIKSLGEDCYGIVNDARITKTRYIEEKTNQMIMRLDENDFVQDSYIRSRKDLKGYDGIVISDYGKGFLDEEDIDFIAKNAECTTFLQTNKVLSDWCLSVDYIKINETEYKRTMHLINAQNRFIREKLIITVGAEGCWYNGKQYPVEEKVRVKSLAGAGDTFLAGFVVSYLRNNENMYAAICFAQECALKVVQDYGVTTV